MRHFRVLLACGIAVASLSGAPARAAGIDRYDALVPMSDGVHLDASVYIPASAPANANLPLVVRQHGGGSTKDNGYDVGYAMKFVDTGSFAVLMYSHRGHGNSEGLFDFFGPRTTLDFSEMLDWIKAQPFGGRIDTNNVGVSGYSQGGGESLLPAENDRRVKAVAVGQTFADLNMALNPNDCYKASFATGIFAGAYKTAGARTQDDLATRWGAQLYSDTQDIGIPGVVPSTTEDLHSRSPLTGIAALIDRRVPVFWTQAWEDQLFPADHPERILKPLRAAGVPVHYWFSSGGHAAGPNDPADERARENAMLNWMDQYLRGVDHGFGSGPLVDYYQRVAPGRPGTWEHHTATDWPLPGVNQTWYPHADATLQSAHAPDGPVGAIANDVASANVANDALVHEVLDRIPGMGDVLNRIPESQNPVDTARFLGAPLGGALNVVGAPHVEVRYETTAVHVMQLATKIWDVSDTSATLVWRGCSSLDPGSGTGTAHLSLWPNAHTFPAGHHIAVTVSAVDMPTFKADVEPSRTSLMGGSSVTFPVV